MSGLLSSLQKAVDRRRALGVLDPASEPIEHRAHRLWFGPGEAGATRDAHWAIDGYGRWLWITEWEQGDGQGDSTNGLEAISAASQAVFSALGYQGAVVLRRPRQGVPSLPELLWGSVPEERFEVREGRRRYWIRLLGSRHPGLFLDHRPLRDWLEHSGECRGRTVLNTFAYTGSLSVAAALGGATQVTTQDLSKATLGWALENLELNGLVGEACRLMAGDFFEDIPRLHRKGQKFGVVIADPPSFSRGKKGNFSTQRDLVRLHEALLSVLEPGGVLVTSINSANIPIARLEAELDEAASNTGTRLEVIRPIEQPATFPWDAGPHARYLKGWVLRSASRQGIRS